MDDVAIIVFVIICIALFITIVVFAIKSHDAVKAEYLRQKYPAAFSKKFGRTSEINSSLPLSDLELWSSADEKELEDLEIQIVTERINKRRAAEEQRRLQEAYRRAQEEQRLRAQEELERKRAAERRAEEERLRKAEEERQRQIEERKAKYAEIEQLYPNGLSEYLKDIENVVRKKQNCIDNLETIKKLDSAYKEHSHVVSWQEAQSLFAADCRNLINSTLDKWGCFSYVVPRPGIDRYGNHISFDFKVWQFFCKSFCKDTSLDYGDSQSRLENYQLVEKLISKDTIYKESAYDRILKFIDALPEKPLVVLGDSSYATNSKELNEYHFAYLKSQLSGRGISYEDVDNKAGIIGSKANQIVIVELITSNEHLADTCNYLLGVTSESSKTIVYVSMLKEFSTSEMSQIIEKKKKEKQAKAELERKAREEQDRLKREEEERQARLMREEQERKERQEREARERKARELEEIERAKQLKSCVASWPMVPYSNNLRFCFLLKYYPTTCEFDATEDIWDDRYLVWNFKNTPGKTGAFQHQQALDNLVPRFATLLQSAFGSRLNELTLFCIPASSEIKTQRRYEDFSRLLCERTGMNNSYSSVQVRGERGAKHEGQSGGEISIALDSNFFKGKNILLLDDVTTSGDSLRTWQNTLERQYGARVIAAVTVGKTTHEL